MANYKSNWNGQNKNSSFQNGSSWGGSNGNSRNGFNRQNQQNVKKSGAVYSRIKTGKNEGGLAVNAWRKTKYGLVTASGYPVDGVEHTNKDGRNPSLRYVVEVVNRDMGTTQTYWCMMAKDTKKIYISELGLVISPNGNGVTASGKRVTGFFGRVY